MTDSVLYKDKNIFVLNKPAGISVHGTTRQEFSKMEKASENSNRGKYSPPHIINILSNIGEYSRLYAVHRLDRDTTGVLLLARRHATAKKFASLMNPSSVVSTGTGTIKIAVSHSEDDKDFSVDCPRRIMKRYMALVSGIPDTPSSGIIRSHLQRIGKYPNERIHSMKVPSASSKLSTTKYTVLSTNTKENISLVEFIPITGRTHQIRVHSSAHLSCPIVGDYKYGFKNLSSSPCDTIILHNLPLFLHHHQMALPSMMSATLLKHSFLAPFPPPFQQILAHLGMSVGHLSRDELH